MFSVSNYGGWNIKRRGDLQFLACGVYIHKGPKLNLMEKRLLKQELGRTMMEKNILKEYMKI